MYTENADRRRAIAERLAATRTMLFARDSMGGTLEEHEHWLLDTGAALLAALSTAEERIARLTQINERRTAERDQHVRQVNEHVERIARLEAANASLKSDMMRIARDADAEVARLSAEADRLTIGLSAATEAGTLLTVALQESLDGCTQKVVSLVADRTRLDWWFSCGLENSVCEGSVDLWWADGKAECERVTHGTSLRNALDRAMRGEYESESLVPGPIDARTDRERR